MLATSEVSVTEEVKDDDDTSDLDGDVKTEASELGQSLD